MDLYGTLQIRWSAGYDGSPLHFISNTTLLHANGNVLRFIDTSGRHVKSLPSHGRGVGPIATAPSVGIIVYAESTLHPKLFALSYPSFQQITTFEGGAELEYVSLAMTSSGKRLASLSGVPDFNLTLWDLDGSCELCRTSVGPGKCQLSFNPLNWKQICVLGQDYLILYSVEQCDDDQFMLTPQETTLPDVSTEVMSTIQPPILPLSVNQVQSKPSETQSHQTRAERLRLPDLSRVLYSDTYDEYTAEKSPVLLSSHCWSSQQTLFVGCRGGQLLSVDFDTGGIQVLANPHLSQENTTERNESETGRGVDQDLPNTAHAVLTEGSLECLALGRRGLFAAGKDGIIYCFGVSQDMKVVESHRLSERDLISSLSWSPDYSRLAIGTQQAAIHIVNPLRLSTSSLLNPKSSSPIVALDTLSPGSSHVVTCRANGTLEVLALSDGSLVSNLSLGIEVCSVTCPISSSSVIIGSTSGHLLAVDLTKTDSPRLVIRKRLYRSPLTHIRSDQRGQFIVTAAASEKNIFVCSGSLSNDIEVLGHTVVRGEVVDLSASTSEPGNEGTKIAAISTINDQTLLTLLNLPNSINIATPDLYKEGTREFSNKYIDKIEVPLSTPASSILLCSPVTLYAVVNNGSCLAKFSLQSLQDKDMESELAPATVISVHDAGTSVKLALSYHQKWISSAGSDGILSLRLVENPEKTITCKPHHYRLGGCSAHVFARDGQCVITVGDKGAIHCWRWEFTNHGSAKGQVAVDYLARAIQSMSNKFSQQNGTLEAMATLDLQAEQERENEATWLQIAEEKAHRAEDEKYADRKTKLRQEIANLRGRLLEMIESNERATELEKLGREEFILDMDQHDRLQNEEERQIQQVREEINLSNLAKMFLREQIKTECWQSMSVRGKIIKGFSGTLEVSNYPMVHQSEDELKELSRVRTLRAIELADREARNEVLENMKKTALAEEPDGEKEDGEDESAKKGEGGEEDSSALYGSHGPKFGGGCKYLYNQFELNSPVAKRHQIILLKDCMRRIAETFNKEFEDVARLKLAEIARIREKNIRIGKIVQQLQLEEKLIQPTLEPEEQPKELFTVQEKEVKVEKYLSPEEKQKQEEAAKLEEERRLAEMGDNPRERALDMMMGGRLEANVEEDLFKDLPRPDFMDKEPAERTEEEIRAALEFEKKEAEFLEEREKLRKALEGELRKLQSTISQSMENFNERLRKLFDLKINTEMAMHQEQLKVVGLLSSLQVEEEVTQREEQLNATLQDKKTLKTHLAGITKAAQIKMEEFREVYEQILTDDKSLDRNFKRDFSDCEPFVDQLYKLFKRRPRGQRLKQGISEPGLVADSTSQNPFPHRPPTATRDGLKSVARGTSEDAMIELDHPSNMPEGVDAHQWDRLVAARQRKRDSEAKVKAAALKLAEMESFLKRRQLEEDRLQTEIQDSFSELNRLSEEKTLFNQDLAVQLLLRQGQVEVEEGDFVPDYSTSVLVHRSVIEELNREIKVHGEGKLASMNECKDFRRGIRQQEWECSRLKMVVEDLQEEVRDVQLLHVTKELQLSLCEGGSKRHDQQEQETLEKTLELNERVHKKKVREKKRQLAKLQAQGQKRRVENRELDNVLVEKQVSVLERQEAERLAGVAPSEAGAQQRMADIVSRRRMVELVRAQAAEIQVLRAELERLRMATFPALVQVE